MNYTNKLTTGQIVYNHAAKDFGVIRRYSPLVRGMAVVDMPFGPAIVSPEILRAATTEELSSLCIKYLVRKDQDQATASFVEALKHVDAPTPGMIV